MTDKPIAKRQMGELRDLFDDLVDFVNQCTFPWERKLFLDELNGRMVAFIHTWGEGVQANMVVVGQHANAEAMVRELEALAEFLYQTPIGRAFGRLDALVGSAVNGSPADSSTHVTD